MKLTKEYIDLSEKVTDKGLETLRLSIRLKISPSILDWSGCVIVELNDGNLYLIKKRGNEAISALDFKETRLTNVVSQRCDHPTNNLVDMTRFKINSDNKLELVNKASDLSIKVARIIHDGKIVKVEDENQESELYRLLDEVEIRWRSGAYLGETMTGFNTKFPIYILKQRDRGFHDSEDGLAWLSWDVVKHGATISFEELLEFANK